MAGTQYSGGKCSGGMAKAFLKHDDQKEREQKEHSNEFLDKTQTYKNTSILGLSYAEKCNKLDSRIAELDEPMHLVQKKCKNGIVTEVMQHVNSNQRKDRVTMQSLIVYVPKDLPPEQQDAWFKDVVNILNEKYGEKNFIDGDIHRDEIHQYMNPKTNEMEWSRVHAHLNYVPEINGVLNGKEFSKRSNIIKVNNAIQKMSEELYGVKYMDGSKQKNNKTVEELKADSYTALQNKVDELKNDVVDLENRKDNLQKHCDAKQKDFDILKTRADEQKEDVYKIFDEKEKLLESQNTALQTIDNLNLTIANLRDTKSALESEIDAANDKIVKREKSVAEKERLLDERASNYDKLDDYKADIEKRINELSNEFQYYRNATVIYSNREWFHKQFEKRVEVKALNSSRNVYMAKGSDEFKKYLLFFQHDYPDNYEIAYGTRGKDFDKESAERKEQRKAGELKPVTAADTKKRVEETLAKFDDLLAKDKAATVQRTRPRMPGM